MNQGLPRETRTFNIRGKRVVGVLLSENDKTVLVRLPSGAVIKRHKVKDRVRLL